MGVGTPASGRSIGPPRLTLGFALRRLVVSPDRPRRVYVTGAGFTRAFVARAPLLVGDFENDRLVDAVRSLPAASRVLEAERNRHPDGFIDIERLMTRLHELMPYDHRHGSADQFAFLLAELKDAFLRTIQHALDGVEIQPQSDLLAFARHCADASATCITFNYDDLLDAALSAAGNWNPYWGYGFFCQPSANTVSTFSQGPHASDQLLLKLHGSVNWWPRLGYAKPFALDAIVHHHGWEGISRRLFPLDVVARHLEPEPVIVPPVLSKSDLVAQPVLRLVWSLAYEHLSTAEGVTFVGYSFPATDTAARVLFAEALADLPADAVTVIGLETDEFGAEALKTRYRDVLGAIPDESFFLGGALDWVQRLPAPDPEP